MAKVAQGTREVYHNSHQFGVDTWTEIDHPDTPKGFVLRRVVTYQLQCARCHRFSIGNLSSWLAVDIRNLQCENCD